MATRQGFQLSLDELRHSVLAMGTATQTALRNAVDSLLTQDQVKASKILEGDKLINNMQYALEDECIRMLARQQPVASDLRRIIAALHISIDLERIADMAVDIAKTTIRFNGLLAYAFQEDIMKMVSIVDSMITLALDSYALEDPEKAGLLSERDDRMDHAYKLTLEHIHDMYSDDEENKTWDPSSYAILARCMERIGDHVTNIGENVIYIITGDRPELN